MQTAPRGAVFFGVCRRNACRSAASLGDWRCAGKMGEPPPHANMKNLTRYLGLLAKLLVFLLVLGFALKNSQSVVFYSYLGYVWQAPLIVMLGLAFVLGALTGVLALLPTLFRMRREAARKPQAVEVDTTTQSDLPVV